MFKLWKMQRERARLCEAINWSRRMGVTYVYTRDERGDVTMPEALAQVAHLDRHLTAHRYGWPYVDQRIANGLSVP